MFCSVQLNPVFSIVQYACLEVSTDTALCLRLLQSLAQERLHDGMQQLFTHVLIIMPEPSEKYFHS